MLWIFLAKLFIEDILEQPGFLSLNYAIHRICSDQPWIIYIKLFNDKTSNLPHMIKPVLSYTKINFLIRKARPICKKLRIIKMT